MDLKISFRNCEVSDGFVRVRYNGTPNFCGTIFNDVKNVAACQEALTEAITKLTAEVDNGEREPGTFYVSIQDAGRKCRGFKDWYAGLSTYVTIEKKTA